MFSHVFCLQMIDWDFRKCFVASCQCFYMYDYVLLCSFGILFQLLPIPPSVFEALSICLSLYIFVYVFGSSPGQLDYLNTYGAAIVEIGTAIGTWLKHHFSSGDAFSIYSKRSIFKRCASFLESITQTDVLGFKQFQFCQNLDLEAAHEVFVA